MKKSPRPNSPEQDLSRKRLGDYGERLAARWYEAQGFTILERQWRAQGGELDLILFCHDTLVFCEVKTRSSVAYGEPIESVTWAKQRRIRNAANQYLQTEHPFARNIRFDVAAVLNGKLEIFADAF